MKAFERAYARFERRQWTAMDVSFLLGACALGAAGMFLLDPATGARRRALVRDKGVRFRHELPIWLDKHARDLRHRFGGRVIAVRKRVVHEQVPDDRLVDRVRATIGRHVTASRALEVAAKFGNVTLRGPILASEVPGVLAATRRVPGVRDVFNALEIHSRPDVPALSGAGRRFARGR